MYTDDDILQELRRVAVKLDRKSVPQSEFRRHSKIGLATVSNRFGSWNAAVEAAGLVPISPGPHFEPKRIDDEELLLDLMRLYREYGKPPTIAIINAKGRFSPPSYSSRWGNHMKAFEIAKKRFPGDPPVPSEQEPVTTQSTTDVKAIRVVPQTIKPDSPKKKRTIFGEPIDFRGLRFAPVNEQGVVYLFGMIGHELGYLIESVRTSFPDCEGKRCFDKRNNQWEHVTIEFEYKSSHFKDHGHNPDECDVIVCWIHDWDNCLVEVLELRDAIRYL